MAEYLTIALYFLSVSVGLSYANKTKEGGIRQIVSVNDNDQDEVVACNWKKSKINKNSTCRISVDEESISKFTHEVKKHQYDVVFLHLNFDDDERYKTGQCVIQKNIWIWTYNGYIIGKQFLKMDPAYKLYSFGILGKHTLEHFEIKMNVNKNCSLIFGTKTTTNVIAKSLLKLTKKLVLENDDYAASYWCFGIKKYIPSDFTYTICNYIICPLGSYAYRCCNGKNNGTGVYCDNNTKHFSDYWWIYIACGGTFLYAYFPLVLMYGADILHQLELRAHGREVRKKAKKYGSIQNCSNYGSIEDCGKNDVHSEFIYETTTNPVTLSSVLIQYILGRIIAVPAVLSRVVRMSFIFISLSVVVLDVGLHANDKRINDLTVARINKGEPLAFLALLPNVDVAKIQFLTGFGGPWLVLLLYVVIGGLLIVTPTDLSSCLANGVPDNTNIVSSPLLLDMTFIERFGSTPVISKRGYARVYMVMRAYIFMVINPSFWVFALRKQYYRLCFFFGTIRNKYNSLIAAITTAIVLIPYLVICGIELGLCVAYYGLPLVSFVLIFHRAYCFWMAAKLATIKRNISCPLWILFVPLTIAMIFFVMYVCSLIFVYSLFFLIKVIVYTYAAMFVYTEEAYNVLTFYFYAVLYYMECVNGFSRIYSQLFIATIEVSDDLQKEDITRSKHFLDYHNKSRGISIGLFEYVIYKQKPKRVQIVFTILKMLVFFVCFYCTLLLIKAFGRWDRINSITNIVTIIFIAGIPKIVYSFYTADKTQSADFEMQSEIRHSILQYWKEVELDTMQSLT